MWENLPISTFYIKLNLRGISTGIYTTNSPEACFHCIQLSNANIIVVEDEKQYEKIEKIRHRLPMLKTVIQYSGVPKNSDVLSVSMQFPLFYFVPHIIFFSGKKWWRLVRNKTILLLKIHWKGLLWTNVVVLYLR